MGNRSAGSLGLGELFQPIPSLFGEGRAPGPQEASGPNGEEIMIRRLSAAGMLVAVVFGVLTAANSAFAEGNGDRGEVVAPGPPPLPPGDIATPPPSIGYVWVPGYWYYQQTGWTWITGRWELTPYPGAAWMPGRWDHRWYGWVWVRGHWQGVAVVVTPPPPVQVEAVVAPPFVGAVWITGAWRWNGGGWAWIPGHWAPAPWRGAVWVPGHWARRPGGWAWVAGFWR
jgi:hypothetical protein